MSSGLKSHPSDETLERYSLGHLSENELEPIEDHLFVCEHCQDAMVLVDSYVQDLKVVCRDLKRQPERSRVGFLNRWLTFPRPVMAGALAAFALALLLPVARYQSIAGTPATIRLETSRGMESAGIAKAEARRPLQLQVDQTQLAAPGPYRAEIVDRNGGRVWSGTAAAANAGLVIDIANSPRSGTYWVRLYGANNRLIREFGLQLY